MNIYAQHGHKVICDNLTGGYESDQELARKHLVVGKEYTVDYTDVHNWCTDVYLVEIPLIHFNSVFFIDKE